MKPELPHAHGSASKTAVLLCNLGTPDAPTAPALRRYLAQFLSDKRVVEIPRALWWLILHGIILRIRPAKSAAKYKSIWMNEAGTPQGSPLRHYTAGQADLLQTQLSASGLNVTVRYAMRYGQPSIASQLDALKEQGATRVLVLPAYPQYCAATTASVLDAVFDWGKQTRALPEFRFVGHYHDDARYIQSLANSVRAHWKAHGRAQVLVMSFHGVPERTLHLGDPYHCECLKTGRLLAESLGLTKEQWRLTFQSRFGKAKWLQPYTEPTLVALAKAGIDNVDVICPGFSSDCLETLEEISLEARHAFLTAGGKTFQYIPCLNLSREWIAALSDIAQQHLQGWDCTQSTQHQQALDRAASRVRALTAGAQD